MYVCVIYVRDMYDVCVIYVRCMYDTLIGQQLRELSNISRLLVNLVFIIKDTILVVEL